MTDHLPPHNLQAEQSVLGSLLIDRDAIAEVADWLAPTAFYHAANATLYKGLLWMWRKRIPADFVTLTDLLKQHKKLEDVGGLAYLSSLLNVTPTAAHLRYYAGIVNRTARQRALIDQAAQLTALAWKEDVDPETVVGAIRRAVEPFAAEGDTDETTFADALDAHQERVEGRWAGTLVEHVIPTGIRSVDRVLMGGLRPGDLAMLGGRPGMGKTSGMLQVAQFAAMSTGKHALIVELEMGKEALFDRAIAAEAGVPFATAYERIGDMGKRELWRHAKDRLKALPVSVETGLRTTDKIAAHCERLAATADLGIIFIDHLDYLADQTRTDNTERHTAELTRRCKRLAQTLNVPVVALAQLNRDVEASPPFMPNLKHFKNSGAIEADCDHAWLLYRRKYYVDKGMLDAETDDYMPQSNQHRAQWIVAKNRNGEVTTVSLGWSPETMSFHDARVA
jgi:replicative DNA helicase